MHAVLSAVVCLLLAPALAFPTKRQSGPPAKKIIIDTDLLSFPDDVAALTLANVFKNKGNAEILGIVSNVNYTGSVPGIDAINIYYGNHNTPFAQDKPVTTDATEPGFPSKIIQNLTDSFSHDIKDGNDPKISTPLDFYLKHLGDAEDHSITIISVGFLTNLAELYNSAHGRLLISRKVKELVVQGGHFDPNPAADHTVGYNLNVNINASLVLQDWPSNVTYIGGELGAKVNLDSSVIIKSRTSPVKNAFDIYKPDGDYSGLSGDPLVLYYSVLGLGDYFVHGNQGGTIKITVDSANVRKSTAVIVDDPTTPDNRLQYYLDLKPDADATALGKALTDLLVYPPPQN